MDTVSQIITVPFSGSNGPNGFIRQVFPVGNVDRILVSSIDGFYLFDARSDSFEKYSGFLEINGQIFDSAVAPFNFSGEIDCEN